MGTRSLICVYCGGRFVVAQYCQWVGYPQDDGEGMEILKFLWGPGNIERLREGLRHVDALTEESREELLNGILHGLESGEPRDPEIDQPYYKPRQYAAEKMLSLWPSLSRNAGAGILEIIAQATAEKHVPVLLGLGFANDTYSCKWAYVVDLDQNSFEVFENSETKQEASTTRFSDVGGDDDTVPGLIKSFSFSQLPATEKEFMRALKAAMKEKDKEMYREFLKSYTNIAADTDDELEVDSDPSCVGEDSESESSDDELSDGEVDIDEEEVGKLLEESTGGMGNTDDAIEADK
ncbi:hypothetical protein V8E54_011502 [Elaphomyces granulatus]